MQTINKQKPVRPFAGLAAAGLHGITDREYFALGKFSNAADKLGLKTTSIGRGPLLGVGCRLQLSGNYNYEVLLNGGIMLLGRIEKDGKRIKLCEGGTNTEAQWTLLLKTVEKEEKR
jgi:hypothetical protein